MKLKAKTHHWHNSLLMMAISAHLNINCKHCFSSVMAILSLPLKVRLTSHHGSCFITLIVMAGRTHYFKRNIWCYCLLNKNQTTQRISGRIFLLMMAMCTNVINRIFNAFLSKEWQRHIRYLVAVLTHFFESNGNGASPW